MPVARKVCQPILTLRPSSADPPALPVGEVVLDPHGDDGADAGEGVGHDADQRPIAQADQRRGVDALQQLARLFGGEHRGLAALDDVLGAAHRNLTTATVDRNR